jgi:hypothetical protein
MASTNSIGDGPESDVTTIEHRVFIYLSHEPDMGGRVTGH